MARTSSYGNYLNRLSGLNPRMPGWVMGSDFGDLQTQLAAADLAQSKADSGRAQALANEMAVEEAQRKGQYEDILTGQIREQSPKTLKDAYAIALGAAQQSGSGDDVMDLMKQIEAMNKEEKTSKFRSIETAAQLAKIDPGLASEYLNTMGIDYKIPPNAGQGKPKKLAPFYNESQNDWEWVDPTDYPKQEMLLRNGYTPGLTKKSNVEDTLNKLLGLGAPAQQATEQQKNASQKVLEEYGGNNTGSEFEIRPGPNGKPMRVMKRSN